MRGWGIAFAAPAAAVCALFSSAQSAAAAVDTSPPAVSQVLPAMVHTTGTPVTVSLVGTQLHDVFAVYVSPPVPQAIMQVVNDNTVLVTLPATLAPGTYALTLTSPLGSSDAQGAVVEVLPSTSQAQSPATGAGGTSAPAQPAGPSAPGGTTTGPGAPATGTTEPPQQPAAPGTPAPSLAPAPVAVEATAAPASVALPMTASLRTAPATVASAAPDPTMYIALASAITVSVVGAVVMMVSRRRRRRRGARRRALPVRMAVGVLRSLRLARSCEHCGRLHSRRRTPRDLWRAGRHCSVTCYVAAQEEEYAVSIGNELGQSRLEQAVAFAASEARA